MYIKILRNNNFYILLYLFFNNLQIIIQVKSLLTYSKQKPLIERN